MEELTSDRCGFLGHGIKLPQFHGQLSNVGFRVGSATSILVVEMIHNFCRIQDLSAR